jgi:hypothetical protein
MLNCPGTGKNGHDQQRLDGEDEGVLKAANRKQQREEESNRREPHEPGLAWVGRPQ